MTSRLPSCSLLDAGLLPIGEIARIAKREGVRPRDAYGAHKWFARRLAATARSLMVAASTPADENFWAAYYGEGSCAGVTVLDPFMGGGVMLLEASRLGADVHGVDVEPVAAAISDFQGRLPAVPDLAGHLVRLRETVGAEMAPFYRSVGPDGEEETLLHAFWVQVVTCRGCGTRYDAHPNARLAWDDAKRREWIVCSGCGDVHERATKKTAHRCGCGVSTKPVAGNVDQGAGVCPCCGEREPLIDVARRTGSPPDFRLFAVEIIPAGPETRAVGSQRRLRAATPGDRMAFEAAAERLGRELAADPGFLAGGVIPAKGRMDDRLLRYGYRDYVELHNARQKLHLWLLARALEGIDGAAGEALRFAFSDHLVTNNVLCAFAGGWRRLAPLFAIRAYRHIARPVEISPWLEKNGRGTFPNAVRAVERAARALRAACEPALDGGVREVAWRERGRWDIRCGDARRLDHIPTGSVDLVLTDPPYFNYIAYSELGHFFTPWLARFGMIARDGLERFPAGQLATGLRGVEASRAFGERLSEAMREVTRVAKPDGRMVFTYQNLDGHGWHGLALALAAAGIRPVRAWPMYGDSAAGLHKKAGSISWDCVVLCKFTRAPIPFAGLDAGRNEGLRFAEGWAARVAEAGYRLSAGDLQNLKHVGAMIEVMGPVTRDEREARLNLTWEIKTTSAI